MKLLVTGGAGYIGGVVVRQLLAAGHQVTVLDDLSTGHADTIPDGVQLIEAPISQVARHLPEGTDGVLHFAAKIAAAESVIYPEKYWQTNVQGSLALLEAVRNAGVPRLVFSSTAAGYGTTDSPMTESTPTRPSNPYGASKLAVDMMITGEARAHGLAAVSLRYFNAAGAAGPLGERHDPETHLIPIALQAAAGEREKLQLYGDDYDTADGSCVRDYIHVEDLATAHVLALESTVPNEHKIYNLGTGSGYSNKQVVGVVRAVTGAPLPVETGPRRDGDAVTVVASAEKAKAELGWRPAKACLEQIVTGAWAFYQSFYGGNR